MLLAKANMLWLLTAFLLLLPTSPCPPPSAQSSLQAQLRAAALVEAPARSANATPHLLSLLDEKDFRDAIANLTSLAELPSKDLLELYRQGLALSPIVHNFDTRYLPLLLNQSNNASEYLLNDWDLFGTLRPLPDNETGSLAVEEWAETRVFPGLPPFAPSLQCSLAACQQRPQYFMLDNWAFAGGDSFFGQMSLTLAQEAKEKLAVVVPMDSGEVNPLSPTFPLTDISLSSFPASSLPPFAPSLSLVAFSPPPPPQAHTHSCAPKTCTTWASTAAPGQAPGSPSGRSAHWITSSWRTSTFSAPRCPEQRCLGNSSTECSRRLRSRCHRWVLDTPPITWR